MGLGWDWPGAEGRVTRRGQGSARQVDPEGLKARLQGCYVTVPTPFKDRPDFPVDEAALRAYVRFLLDNGLAGDYATLLAGGAAGDFSTMTFEERRRVAAVVIHEVGGRAPVAMGAQTTSTLELMRLAETAQELGSIWTTDEAYPAILGLRLGDAQSLAGFGPRAVMAYAGAHETTSRFYRGARAVLLLRMHAADRPDIIDQLVRGDDPAERAGRLSALRDSTGAAFVFAALLWAEADDYREAVNALKAAAGSQAAISIGERYWSWLASFAYRARQFDSAERFRTLAVESALEAGDVYQVARLEDFGERISWARTIGSS